MECFIGNFDGCDYLAISCSKCASSKSDAPNFTFGKQNFLCERLFFEASILGATSDLRIIHHNSLETETTA
ncbi:MAG: hypothetical protein ABF652_19290 [Clostridium beijerinckii]